MPTQVPMMTNFVVGSTLERLNMAGSYLPTFPSPFPSNELDMFPGMSRLRELILRRSSIKTMAENSLMSLQNLSYLNLAENQLHEVPKALKSLSELLHLDISYQCTIIPCQLKEETFQLTDTSFQGMNSLRRLDIRGVLNSLTSSSLASLAGLEELDISSFLITSIDGLAFQHTPSLRSLTCSQCWVLETIPLQAWHDLAGLHTLDLSYSPKAIVPASNNTASKLLHFFGGSFPDLRVLNLTCSLVSDQTLCDEYLYQYSPPLDPTLLISMVSLEVLHLGKNGLTSWTERLFVHNPALKMLSIEQNKFRSLTPAMLEDFEG